MKRKLSLFMAAVLLCSACAGTVSATPTAPKKNVVTMTIPSSYGYVYDRLAEAFPHYRNNYYDYDIMPIEMPIEEIIEEEVIMEAPAMAAAPAKDMIVAEEAVEEAVVEEAAVQTGGGDYSKTNVQVEGIDEGDIVKTDGEYIYVLKNSGALVILEADGKNTSVLSRTAVTQKYKDYSYQHYNTTEDHGPIPTYSSEYARDLYVSGDYVAVILDQNRSYVTRTNGINRYTDASGTFLSIFDVSDPADPEKLTTLGQSGYHQTSRMIGDSIYLITDFFLSTLNEREFYEAYIPSLYCDGTPELVPVNSIIVPPEINSRHFTVITEYDLSEQKIVSTKSVLTETDTVYMNSEHLYLADERPYEDILEEYKESIYTVTETVSGRCTDIYKFALGDTIKTKAFCTVEGRLLNQFSMDEYKGNLRLVTTNQTSSRKVYKDKEFGFTNTKWNSSEQTNGLYIYDENLDLLGSITGLAKDERVYSVRFTGDTGYFVTFRETDPLFAVDLSNPKAPKIMSALKIPGFSEYLHPYGKGLLFGLGQDATEQGWTTGVKLSMFDTSDPYDVQEIHKKKLDIGYTTALNNHKAILISAERGIIGFPSGSGYCLYGYDPAKGFYEITEMEIGGWSNNARGLYIGDMLYIVFQERTVVLDMKTYDIAATVKY